MPAATTPTAPPPVTAPQTPAQTPMGTSFGDMESYATAEEGDSPLPESKPASPPQAKPGKPTKGPQTKPAQAKPATPPATQPKEEDGEQEGEVKAPEGTPTEEGKSAEKKLGPDGKPLADKSPWTLVEKFKKDNVRLQRELAELREIQKPGELPKEHAERFSAIEKRNQELEEEIRFVNYSKSKEYQETYQKPYEEAWSNALSELKELTITNEDGTSRQATAHDLLALANMGLGQARATAKQWFGDAADDIMAHRRTLRELSDKQSKALDNAKKNGSEREAQMMEERKARLKAHAEEQAHVWNTVNKDALEKYEYLRPVEGQTERNEMLEKATKFVDETFGLNVNRAKTQEERDHIIRRHAALRNRAIGFSTLKFENTSLRSKVAELEKMLEEYQGSEPTGGRERQPDNGEHASDSMEGLMASMAKLAS